MDFQSPDEIEAKTKRLATSKSTNAKPSPTPQSQPPTIDTSLSPITTQIPQSPPIKLEPPSEFPMTIKREALDIMDVDGIGMDNLDDIDTSGDSDGDDGENPLLIDTTVRKSAYMTEKSTKKKIYKDGKVSNIYI